MLEGLRHDVIIKSVGYLLSYYDLLFYDMMYGRMSMKLNVVKIGSLNAKCGLEH